jgi:hypothetical protein
MRPILSARQALNDDRFQSHAAFSIVRINAQGAASGRNYIHSNTTGMNEVQTQTPLQPLDQAAAEMQAIADQVIASRRFQPQPAAPKPLPRRPAIVQAELDAVQATICLSDVYADDYSVVCEHERKLSRVRALRAELREVTAPHTDPEAVIEPALNLARLVIAGKANTYAATKDANDVLDRASGIDLNALRQRVAARHYAAQAALATKGGAL